MNRRFNLSIRLILLYVFVFIALALLIFLPEYSIKIKLAIVMLAGGIISMGISRFIIKPVLSVVEDARETSIDVVKSDLHMKLLNEKLEKVIGDNMGLNASLRNKNEDMQALLYSISHDLRAPLTGIDGYVQLLGEKIKAAPEYTKYVEKIKESTDTMNTMITSLLDLSRIDGKEEPSKNIDIQGSVDIIKGMLDPQLDKKKIKLIFREKLLPAFGRKHRVHEIFQNLMQNAVKFSRDIEGAYIEVGSKPLAGGFVEYFVRDNGIGIDFPDQGKVFLMFYKVKETGREGHGIGLAIVKKIVESHGGKIRIESKKNAGTAFYFTLPAAK